MLVMMLSAAMLSVRTTTLPPLRAAVIVPGFLSAASDFRDLATALTADGIRTEVVPMSVFDWLPMLFGRSLRPILERIDLTVRHVAAEEVVPPASYSPLDLAVDFVQNPGGVAEVGGSAEPDDYPLVEPRGSFATGAAAAPPPRGRIALIGHSAGGFYSRIFLSGREYGGRAYGGSALVHSLVTLGTPHTVGRGVPFVNVAWASREGLPAGVRCMAVGATGTPGDSSGELTRGAYSFCEASGTGGELLDGDGVTTTSSALDLPGAEALTLEGVTHYPWTAPGPIADLVAPELTAAYRDGKPWYGSDGARQRWAQWLLEGIDGCSAPGPES